jgi:hypothetical protein
LKEPFGINVDKKTIIAIIVTCKLTVKIKAGLIVC